LEGFVNFTHKKLGNQCLQTVQAPGTEMLKLLTSWHH